MSAPRLIRNTVLIEGGIQLRLAPGDGRAARFTKLERKPLFEAEQ